MLRQRSTALPLALVYVLLVVYASLYPFSGWRWPAGATWSELLWLTWPPWRNRFDEWSNFLGYAPLGALLALGWARSGLPLALGVLAALCLPALLSYAMECTQHFIPRRVPSGRDWVLNAGGAAMGVGLALGLVGLGWVDRWRMWRLRWFEPQASPALVLLLLWPVALLFPAPVALSLGQVFEELRAWIPELLAGTPWDGAVAPPAVQGGVLRPMLSPWAEGAAVAAGLMAPCLLAFSVLRQGRRRLVVAFLILVLALATTALSTALNFGPVHAWAWLTPTVMPGLAVGSVLILAASRLGPRQAAVLGLGALVTSVLLGALAPADPYFAASLQLWEQGQFIRFHGMSQWLGWLWPYAAMGGLMARLAGAR
jgi:VanZ family protein